MKIVHPETTHYVCDCCGRKRHPVSSFHPPWFACNAAKELIKKQDICDACFTFVEKLLREIKPNV